MLLNFLQNRCQLPYLLPFYHAVSDEPCPHISPLYPVRTLRQFEADLDYLCTHFQSVALSELHEIQQDFQEDFQQQKQTKNTFSKPAFHLTFDDGLRQCFAEIRPVLLRKGINATFFINSQFVDNQQLMYRYAAALLLQAMQKSPRGKPAVIEAVMKMEHSDSDEILELCGGFGVDLRGFLRDYRPYCTTNELRQLVADGFSLGSHSQNHPLYARLTLAEQLAQTIDSQRFIEKEIYQFPDDSLTPRPANFVRAFAFPFTDDGVKAEFWRALKAELPFDLTFGTAGIKGDNMPNHLQRLVMETANSEATAAQILRKNYLAHWLKRALGRHIVKHI
jgi:peptidoglycan/xylan/chitin deacetylase (PgdA/CDA1 family)